MPSKHTSHQEQVEEQKAERKEQHAAFKKAMAAMGLQPQSGAQGQGAAKQGSAPPGTPGPGVGTGEQTHTGAHGSGHEAGPGSGSGAPREHPGKHPGKHPGDEQLHPHAPEDSRPAPPPGDGALGAGADPFQQAEAASAGSLDEAEAAADYTGFSGGGFTGSGLGDEAAQQAAESRALRAKLEQLEKDVATWKARASYHQAELENFQRRADSERIQIQNHIRGKLLEDLIPVSENLHLALGAAEKQSDLGPFLEGVRLIERHFLAALEKNGVAQIAPMAGDPFSSAHHQALSEIVSETQPPGTIVQVHAYGYRVGERLVKAAQVLVSKAPEGRSEERREADGKLPEDNAPGDDRARPPDFRQDDDGQPPPTENPSHKTA